MYRYWTGTVWTAAVTANPQLTPPPVDPLAASQPGAGGYPTPTRSRGAVGWWLAGIAALTVVGLVIWFLMQGFGAVNNGGGGPGPGGVATPDICPPASSTATALPSSSDPGRITGGKLAYPALGDPWLTDYDNRVPFGSLAMMQKVTDQENYDGQNSDWMASILVSDLFVGDGFASTKVGAETVLKCVLGTYYSDTVVTQTPISSKAHDVDGRDGWLIETQLSFDISGLNAKGERVLLLVVQTGTDEYGLFYASVPDTRTNLIPDAETALANLRVLG